MQIFYNVKLQFEIFHRKSLVWYNELMLNRLNKVDNIIQLTAMIIYKNISG